MRTIDVNELNDAACDALGDHEAAEARRLASLSVWTAADLAAAVELIENAMADEAGELCTVSWCNPLLAGIVGHLKSRRLQG